MFLRSTVSNEYLILPSVQGVEHFSVMGDIETHFSFSSLKQKGLPYLLINFNLTSLVALSSSVIIASYGMFFPILLQHNLQLNK